MDYDGTFMHKLINFWNSAKSRLLPIGVAFSIVPINISAITHHINEGETESYHTGPDATGPSLEVIGDIRVDGTLSIGAFPYDGTATAATSGGSDGFLDIGFGSNSNGVVNLNGASRNGTVFTLDGGLRLGIGDGATGTLTINGGTLASTGSSIGNLNGGMGNATGILNVIGEQSVYKAGQSLYIAERGAAGYVNVIQGGLIEVNGESIDMARGSVSSYAEVLVSGLGSTLRTITGGLFIGRSGTAILNIEDGGNVSISNYSRIGYESGSIGTLNVKGNKSTYDNKGTLRVGVSGIGRVNVTDGGKATSTGIMYIGDEVTGQGFVTVGDVSSINTSNLIASSNLIVGEHGKGSLLVEKTGEVSVGGTFIVANQNSRAGDYDDASVLVDGGSIRTVKMEIGSQHKGEMTIRGGGLTEVTDTLSVGTSITGDGMLKITGTGSSLSVFNDLWVGQGGTGYLELSDNSELYASAVRIGHFSTSTGSVLVTGKAKLNAGTLNVGASGKGSLTIENGGQATITGDTTIGREESSNGTVTVSGTGASFDNAGEMIVGNSGIGILSVVNGGSLSSLGITRIGGANSTSSSGSVFVTGESSSLSSAGISVGDYQKGILMVKDKGTVSASNRVIIGARTGSEGTVTVSGVGSKLETTGTSDAGRIVVGDNGSGSLTVKNGATVKGNSFISIGTGGDNSSGTIIVTGNSSSLAIAGSLRVGAGSIIVENGAHASTGNQLTIGYTANKEARALVSGSNSSLSSIGSTDILVGGNGNGTLIVSNGGHVSASSGQRVQVGTESGASGRLFIGGESAEAAFGTLGNDVVLNSTGSLIFNHSGDNAFSNIISGNGTLWKTGTSGTVTTLNGTNTNFNGKINIDHGVLSFNSSSSLGNASTTSLISLAGNGALRTTGSGISTKRNIHIGSGGGRLDVTGQNLTLAGTITGSNTLNKTGSGLLLLEGTSNDFTGNTVILAGSLLLKKSTTTYSGIVNVQSGTTYGGIGIHFGSVNLATGAILQVGGVNTDTALGRLSISNGFNASSGSIIQITLSDVLAGDGGYQHSTLDLAGALNSNLANITLELKGTPTDGNYYNIITGISLSELGATTGTQNGSLTEIADWNIVSDGYSGTAWYDAASGNVHLIISGVVPEPASWALIAATSLFAVMGLLRRENIVRPF